MRTMVSLSAGIMSHSPSTEWTPSKYEAALASWALSLSLLISTRPPLFITGHCSLSSSRSLTASMGASRAALAASPQRSPRGIAVAGALASRSNSKLPSPSSRAAGNRPRACSPMKLKASAGPRSCRPNSALRMLPPKLGATPRASAICSLVSTPCFTRKAPKSSSARLLETASGEPFLKKISKVTSLASRRSSPVSLPVAAT